MSAWGCFKLKKIRIKIFVNKIKRGSLFWKRSHFTTPQFFFFQIKLVCFIFLYKFWWLQSKKSDPELIHNYESPKSKKTPKFWRKTILVTFLVVIHFFQNLPAFEKSYFVRHLSSVYYKVWKKFTCGFFSHKKRSRKRCWKVYDTFCCTIIYILSDE